jgi:hypothetical protein
METYCYCFMCICHKTVCVKPQLHLIHNPIDSVLENILIYRNCCVICKNLTLEYLLEGYFLCNKNKILKVYSLEYTDIPKVFSTLHHIGRWFSTYGSRPKIGSHGKSRWVANILSKSFYFCILDDKHESVWKIK